MGKCICKTTCWTPGGFIFAGWKTPDEKPVEYDLDPRESYAIHFQFFDPEEEKIRKTNELLQLKGNLEHSLTVLDDRKVIDRTMIQLQRVENQLKDVANIIKEKAMQPAKPQMSEGQMLAEIQRLRLDNEALKKQSPAK